METLLAVGLGLLVIVVILAKYELLTKFAHKRKKRRDNSP